MRSHNKMRTGLRVALVVVSATLLFFGWLVLYERIPTGTVTGRITFKGQPLPRGMVVLLTTEDGQIRTYPGLIHKDGTYTVANVPTGPAKVAVASGRSRNDAPADRIPRKYRDPDTSGLSFEMRPGTQNFSVDLQDDESEPD